MNDEYNKDDERIGEYIGKDILFAKVNERRIIERSNVPRKLDPKLLLAMTRSGSSKKVYERDKNFCTLPDYAESSERYDGVHFEKEPPTDIETIAVWNTRCLTEMVRFKGVGNWTYDKTPTYEKRETVTLTQLCKKHTSPSRRRRFIALIPKDLKYDGRIVEEYMTEKHTPIPDTSSELFTIGKPKNSIMFTHFFRDIKSRDQSRMFIPEIYEWLSTPENEQENKASDISKSIFFSKRGNKQTIFNYLSRCDIAFGNVDEFKIFDPNEKKIPMSAIPIKDKIETNLRCPDYEEISKIKSKDNHGVDIHVSDIRFRDLWGVDTIAVWDRNCIEAMTYYRNCGQWTYEKEAVFDYKNPEYYGSDDE